MNQSSVNRNIVIGVAAAIVIAIIAFLIIRGCDAEETRTTPASTTQTTRTQATPTATQAATSTTSAIAPEEPAAAGPEPAPAAPAAEPAIALEIVDRSVNPEVSNPGDSFTFTVLVRGTADRVVVSGERISGGGMFDFELSPAGTTGGVTTWTLTTTATTLTGDYRYYARAFGPDGAIVEMPGVSGYTFRIEP